jgi:hypothetical protein
MVEEDRVVCIRFGHDWDEQCMVMDETLYQVQAKVQNFAVIYLGKLRRDLGDMWRGDEAVNSSCFSSLRHKLYMLILK